MKDSKLQSLVNVFSLIFFLLSLTSGIIIWQILPLGAETVWNEILGLNRLEWREIHTYSSIIFGVLIFGHLAYNLNWFLNLKREIGEKISIGERLDKNKIMGILVVFSVIIGGIYLYQSGRIGEKASTNLKVTGLVKDNLKLSLEEIKNMPETSLDSPLYCVDGYLVTEGDWKGVSLNYVLRRAGVKENVTKIAFYASDGFTTDMELDTVMNDDTILIGYEKNGKPLSVGMRMVVPGRWGYKWIKWLEEIRLVSHDFKGLYENHGYPDNAIIENPPES